MHAHIFFYFLQLNKIKYDEKKMAYLGAGQQRRDGGLRVVAFFLRFRSLHPLFPILFSPALSLSLLVLCSWPFLRGLLCFFEKKQGKNLAPLCVRFFFVSASFPPPGFAPLFFFRFLACSSLSVFWVLFEFCLNSRTKPKLGLALCFLSFVHSAGSFSPWFLLPPVLPLSFPPFLPLLFSSFSSVPSLSVSLFCLLPCSRSPSNQPPFFGAHSFIQGQAGQ